MAGQPYGLGVPGWLAPGTQVAGYVIEEQVGAGGMAVVFRARDEVLGRLAAIKVLAPALAADEEFRARFLRESRAAASVDEPHIIPVFSAGEADGVLYIATRFVAGGDLGALVRRNRGPLDPQRAVAFTAQVASALDAAHRAGLVHRDVKPGNILVDMVPGKAEHAYLSDFGLTRAASSVTGLTATGQFMGTPDYCAPEQIRGWAVDGRTDQYALACMAFFLLTGVPPFQRAEVVATLFAQLNDPVPAAASIRPGLPPAVDPVLARAMAKSPQDRYASCAELVAALRDALGSARQHPVRSAPPALAGYPAPGGGPGHPGGQARPGGPQGSGPPGGGTPAVLPASLPPRTFSSGILAGRRTTIIAAGLAAVILAVAATVTALVLPGSGHSPGTGAPAASASSPAGSTGQAAGSAAIPHISAAGVISAAGSAVQAGFQAAAIEAFESAAPGVTVSYDGTGSAAGIADLSSGTVLFAGSDAPVTADQQSTFLGQAVLYFPVQLGSVAIAVDLRGVTSLHLDAPALAGIFQGTITTWNAPAIRALNPTTTLPSTPIVAVARSDASATTQYFSKFLSEAAGSAWTLGSDSTIRWPRTDRSASGDTGVAQVVQTTDGAIGYVDEATAKATGLTVASVKNKSGGFVAPSPAAATAAAASAALAANLTFQATWQGGAAAYPITYQSWDLVYATQSDPNDATLVKAYLGFLLSSRGQALLAPLGLAPLPPDIDHAAVAQLGKVTS